MENLYKYMFPNETYSGKRNIHISIFYYNYQYVIQTAHRALEDVEAMKRVFTTTSLVELLSDMPTRSATTQLTLWIQQRERRVQIQRWVAQANLTKSMAEGLVRRGLTYATLLGHSSKENQLREFLISQGITRKLWLERLWSHFSSRPRSRSSEV